MESATRNTSDLPATESVKRFGAFSGVFTPSILTILGVIMYMRFGWVVGSAGLAGTLLIVVVSHMISMTTGLSVSSIATNRRVGAGGAYFMISRTLGAPAGAAIGIPLFLGQALSVTFYIVGFSESLTELVPGLNQRLMPGPGCLIYAQTRTRSAYFYQPPTVRSPQAGAGATAPQRVR